MAEFVSWAKSHPTQVSFGTPAAGSLPHFIGVMIGRAAGIDMVCIGNNLLDEEAEMAGVAEAVERALRDETLGAAAIGRSVARVQKRKTQLA